jgi:hypothetical protein
LKKYSDHLSLKEFLQSPTKTVKSIYPCLLEWQQANFEVKISGGARSSADELVKKAGICCRIFWQDDKKTMEINCMQTQEK